MSVSTTTDSRCCRAPAPAVSETSRGRVRREAIHSGCEARRPSGRAGMRRRGGAACVEGRRRHRAAARRSRRRRVACRRRRRPPPAPGRAALARAVVVHAAAVPRGCRVTATATGSPAKCAARCTWPRAGVRRAGRVHRRAPPASTTAPINLSRLVSEAFWYGRARHPQRPHRRAAAARRTAGGSASCRARACCRPIARLPRCRRRRRRMCPPGATATAVGRGSHSRWAAPPPQPPLTFLVLQARWPPIIGHTELALQRLACVDTQLSAGEMWASGAGGSGGTYAGELAWAYVPAVVWLKPYPAHAPQLQPYDLVSEEEWRRPKNRHVHDVSVAKTAVQAAADGLREPPAADARRRAGAGAAVVVLGASATVLGGVGAGRAPAAARRRAICVAASLTRPRNLRRLFERPREWAPTEAGAPLPGERNPRRPNSPEEKAAVERRARSAPSGEMGRRHGGAAVRRHPRQSAGV